METMSLGTVTGNELTLQFPGDRRINMEHFWRAKWCGLWGTVWYPNIISTILTRNQRTLFLECPTPQTKELAVKHQLLRPNKAAGRIVCYI